MLFYFYTKTLWSNFYISFDIGSVPMSNVSSISDFPWKIHNYKINHTYSLASKYCYCIFTRNFEIRRFIYHEKSKIIRLIFKCSVISKLCSFIFKTKFSVLVFTMSVPMSDARLEFLTSERFRCPTLIRYKIFNIMKNLKL